MHSSSPLLLCVLNSSGQIIQISHPFFSVCVHYNADWVQQPFAGIVVPEDLDKVGEALVRLRVDGRPVELDLRFCGSGEPDRPRKITVCRSDWDLYVVWLCEQLAEGSDAVEDVREEQMLRQVADEIPVGVLVAEDETIRYVNERTCLLLGISKEQFEQLPASELRRLVWFERLEPEERRKLEEGRHFLDEAAGSDGWSQLEGWITLPDGERRCIMNRTALFQGKGGRTIRFIVLMDVTASKEAERKLRESEMRYRSLMEYSLDGNILEVDGKIVYVNPIAQRVAASMGLTEPLEGRDLSALIPPADRDRFLRDYGTLKQSTEPSGPSEWRFEIPGKGPMYYESATIPMVIEGKPALQLIFREVTAHKVAQEKLTVYGERLHHLNKKLMKVREDERRALADELHDEIGQALTALQLSLRMAQRKATTPKEAESIQGSIEIAEQLLQQVRNLALELHPSILDDLGLVPAMRWFLDRQAQLANLSVRITAVPSLPRLPSDIELLCFRVTQEAVTNIIRHAHATMVDVEVTLVDGTIHVMVRDNGRGFDVAWARRVAVGNSLGVLGMEERAASAGGKLEILSEEGKGTEVHLHLPLPAAEGRG